MTIEIIIVHPPDYNEQANLPVVSLLSLRRKDGLSMGFKHNRVLLRDRQRQENQQNKILVQYCSRPNQMPVASVSNQSESSN